MLQLPEFAPNPFGGDVILAVILRQVRRDGRFQSRAFHTGPTHPDRQAAPVRPDSLTISSPWSSNFALSSDSSPPTVLLPPEQFVRQRRHLPDAADTAAGDQIVENDMAVVKPWGFYPQHTAVPVHP